MRYDALRISIESFGAFDPSKIGTGVVANDAGTKLIIRRAKAFDKFLSKDARYDLKDSDVMSGPTVDSPGRVYDVSESGTIHHADPEVHWDVISGRESAIRVEAAWDDALDAVLALGTARGSDETVRVGDVRESIEGLRKGRSSGANPDAGTSLE